MPSSQSKISFDAINIVKAENIYLSDSSKDRSARKRSTSTHDDIMNQMKTFVPDLVLKNPRTNTKKPSNKPVNVDFKSKMVTAGLIAAKKSRKRQIDIGNAYSKLNSNRKQPVAAAPVKPTTNDPKLVLCEASSSRSSSFYHTPRQSLPVECENINPNQLENCFFESELDNFIKTQYPDFGETLDYDLHKPIILENFDLPPDTFQPDNGLKHFKRLLDQEESSKNKLLEKNEIALLKEIVKADERYQQLKKSDYQLLKEILIGQLKEISEQERVIKLALEKIRFRKDSRAKVDSNSKIVSSEINFEYSHKSSELVEEGKSDDKSMKQQEVDIFFKNVPSLEREIRILKLLATKLEKSLIKPVDEAPALDPTPIEAPAPASAPPTAPEPPTPPAPPTPSREPLVIASSRNVNYAHIIHYVSCTVHPKGQKSETGLAEEFKISHQTIDELKLERDFYIATDLNNFTLERTNFNMLKHNPELLMPRLKPITKESRLKFNLIEQDPIFFNHFLAKMCKISADSLNTPEPFTPKRYRDFDQITKNMMPAYLMRGAGDHFDMSKMKRSDMLTLDPPNIYEIIAKKKPKLKTPSKPSDSITPKNNLVKILLLGTLHLTIILMILTAILYPEIICL